MVKWTDYRKIDGEYINVYLTPEGKEVILIGEVYYYLNKSGLTISNKKYGNKIHLQSEIFKKAFDVYCKLNKAYSYNPQNLMRMKILFQLLEISH